jgi:predicted membrane channel-forming protein YqfA (hemolysin III family)
MDLSRELSSDICPGQISWHSDRAEIIADGVVHAIGVCLGLLGAVTIVVISINTERVDVAPILVYVIGLVTLFASRLRTICGRCRPPSGFCVASTIPRSIY